MTLRAHDKVDVYRILKLTVVYDKFYTITIVDLAVESLSIGFGDPLEIELIVHDMFRDAKNQELSSFLDVELVGIHRSKVGSLI